LDTSQVSTELVIGPKMEKTSLDKKFVVVLKHTVQIMPGITKWIDVQVQEQPSIIDSRTDAIPCSILLIQKNLLSSVLNTVLDSILAVISLARLGQICNRVFFLTVYQ